MHPIRTCSSRKARYVCFFIITIIPAIGSCAKDWVAENIKLSNYRSTPTVPFKILPNTQKFGVYDSTACEGCGNESSMLFSRSDFKEGQANRLIHAIEISTGLKIPEGPDATERLNSLMKDSHFHERLLEMSKSHELPMLDFSLREFKGSKSPAALLKAVQTGSQIPMPAKKTPIESLNWLLGYADLYKFLPKRPAEAKDIIHARMGHLRPGQRLSASETIELNNALVKSSETREFIARIEKGQKLNRLEVKVLNRFLIESNYPSETPELPDALTIVKSIHTLQFRRRLTLEEIRALLEATYPQETPITFCEKYQRVETLLPVSVRNGVFVTNKHLFTKDGTHIHFAFSNDDKMYYGIPAMPGFELIQLDTITKKTKIIAHLYVGDYTVPNLRINTISISPDNKKIALDITSDVITYFGDSYHDLLVLNLGTSKTEVIDLGNKASYGGWWSPASDMFYTSCPLSPHGEPRYHEVCGISLD
jgi:hypothetical protein